jgi:hypothetical protein
MTDRINYVCSACGKKRTLPANEPTPECCKKAMSLEPLPVCEMAPSAEHSRMDDDSGPCDDGRAGGNV